MYHITLYPYITIIPALVRRGRPGQPTTIKTIWLPAVHLKLFD